MLGIDQPHNFLPSQNDRFLPSLVPILSTRGKFKVLNLSLERSRKFKLKNRGIDSLPKEPTLDRN